MFIDEICTVNDDGEFSSSYKYIYLKQLELKLEHQGEDAKFLDLEIIHLRKIYLQISFLSEGTIFLSLLYIWLVCGATSQHQYFQTSYE